MTNKIYPATGGAEATRISCTYTPDGKLSKRTWARSIGPSRLYTSYSYDSLGQITNISYSDDTPDITFTHDRLDRQVSVVDAQGTRTFGYDPATLALTNETIVADGVTNVISRTQDSLGRSSGIALFLPSDTSYRSDYSYSSLGRFGSVSSLCASVSSVVDYSYLPNSDTPIPSILLILSKHTNPTETC